MSNTTEVATVEENKPVVLNKTAATAVETFVSSVQSEVTAGATRVLAFLTLITKGKIEVTEARKVLNDALREAMPEHKNPSAPVGRAARGAAIVTAIADKTGETSPAKIVAEHWELIDAASRKQANADTALKAIGGKRKTLPSADEVKPRSNPSNPDDVETLTFDAFVNDGLALVKQGLGDLTAKSVSAWETLVKQIDDEIARREGDA